MEWTILPLKRYADFSGRSRRKEYWLYTLLIVVAVIVASILDNILGMGMMFYAYGPLAMILLLGTLVPSIAVGVRRLHDQNRSGWFMLLGLIPFVGGIILLIFFVMEGTSGPNQYGPDPKASDLAGLV